jgi:hypothetical protein
MVSQSLHDQRVIGSVNSQVLTSLVLNPSSYQINYHVQSASSFFVLSHFINLDYRGLFGLQEMLGLKVPRQTVVYVFEIQRFLIYLLQHYFPLLIFKF